LDALHVLVQMASQVAPIWQVRVLPAPIVAEQWLPVSHMTLAEAPAVRLHVALIAHSRFELSAAVIVQLLCSAHWVSHDAPQLPVHDAPAEHERLHPAVPLWHCPVEARLQVVWLGQVQLEPMQEGGLMGPPEAGIPTPVELPPQARKMKAAKAVEYLIMQRSGDPPPRRYNFVCQPGGRGGFDTDGAGFIGARVPKGGCDSLREHGRLGRPVLSPTAL
jgi:hypothetical protein